MIKEKIELLNSGHYIIKSILQKYKIIVDLGACHGDTILEILNDIANIEVYAIEPSKSNFNKLKQNLKTIKNLTLINKALSAKDIIPQNKLLEFVEYRSPEWHKFSMYLPSKTRIRNKYLIPVISINELMDNIIKSKIIGYMKIDIEGAEEFLFADFNEQIAKRIKQISIEIHENSKDKIINKAIQFCKKLTNLNYLTYYDSKTERYNEVFGFKTNNENL